jgi:hypothetical protein
MEEFLSIQSSSKKKCQAPISRLDNIANFVDCFTTIESFRVRQTVLGAYGEREAVQESLGHARQQGRID